MSFETTLGAPIAAPQTRPLGRETRVRMPAALDALITAIFARIFARLEQLLALWQAGTLPTPQPRATVHRPAHPRSTRTPALRRTSQAKKRNQRAPSQLPAEPCLRARLPRPRAKTALAPSATAAPHPRRARDPPSPQKAAAC